MFVDPASGKSWIALGGINEIWRLDADFAAIEARRKLPRPRWPANFGPEAMVRLADGRTIVLSEGADDDPRGREALLYVGDPAEPGPEPIRFLYDSDGRGTVSGAAPLPDGRLPLGHRRPGFDPVFPPSPSVTEHAALGTRAT